MAQAISVKDLTKSFGKLEVLKGISFEVPQGQILAVLGPNGAGKTTTVRILATLLKGDGGKALVDGHDVAVDDDKVRESIGLTGQFAAVDEYLTGHENIAMIGRLYHMPKKDAEARATELLEKFDLTEAGGRPARGYSGGMKRRLDLAMSLVARPDILFLDEPTTGLDPRSRLDLWKMIKQLAKDGKTILLTTQYMEEADFLADNIIVIDHGTIIAEGTSSQLKAKAGADQVEITFANNKQLQAAHDLIGGQIQDEELRICIPAKKGVATLHENLDKLQKANIKADTASIRRPTLDDVFLALTGHQAEDKKTDQEAKS